MHFFKLILTRVLKNNDALSVQNYPTLNLNTVIIEALELWLQGTDQVKLEKDRELFINDNSTGFGPRAKD